MRSFIVHIAVLAALAAIVFIALGLVGPTPGQDPTLESTDAARPLPVETFEAKLESEVRLPRRFTGELRARRTVDLSFEVSGAVTEVLVEDGAVVSASAPLARLDTARLDARRAELEATRRRVVATLDELVAGPRAEVLDAARADVDAVEVEVSLVDSRLERRRALAGGAVSQERISDLESERAALEARRAAAEARLAELESGTRAERLEAQRAALAEVDAGLAAIDVELADAVLVAPFDGVIERRLVDEGALVAPGTPALRFVEAHRLEAWIGITQEASDALEPDLEIEAQGRRVVADSWRLLPELDRATRTRTLVAQLRAEDSEALAPGEIASVAVDLPTSSSGFWLPVEALTSSTRGLWSCYVARESDGDALRAERALVEVLHVLGDRVLVRGTLEEGDRVIAGGVHALVPGQAVELAPRSVARR